MKTKRIHKVLASLLILAIVGFTSCKKEEVVKVFGFVQGFAYDGVTNTVIDDVKVTWEVSGNQDSTTATATEGYKIDDLYSGEYNLVFSKTGYSTVIHDIYVPMDDFTATVKGGANKEYMVSYDPVLYPLNAVVTGRVYKIENGVNIPIEGAVVRVELPQSNLIPRVYEGTTDVDGYYNFANIPAVSYVYIRVLEYTDSNGEKYNDYYNDFNIVSGAVTTISPISLGQITDDLRLTNTNLWIAPSVPSNEFEIDASITLVFNKNVDEDVTDDRGGYVTLSGGGTYDVAYSGNTITITPDADLTVSTLYNVSFDVYGTQPYEHRTGSINFTTAAAK